MMKRGIIFLLILIVIGGATAGFWYWARTSPEAVVQFLVGGGLQQAPAESFVAWLGGTLAQEEEAEVLVASGTIEGTQVAIVSEFGGRIVRLDVREGDEVQAGQPLVWLDTSLLQAQMAQARAAVLAAESNLANVEAGTHPAEILGAQAALRQAFAERDAAETAWSDAQLILQNPQEIEAQIVEARTSVELAEVQIEQAQAQVAAAEADRFQYRARGSMEEKWLYEVYDYQVQAAQQALEAARAQKTGARQVLAALEALRDQPLAILSQINLAEAHYNLAMAGVHVAQAQLDELQAGPAPEAVAVARAQVEQAEAAVAALQAQIGLMTLSSPIDGLVSSRSARAGEAALAGATLLTVANLDEVRLTIYLPEDELGRVYLGQQVEVQVDSYPDRAFTGTISYISQQAEFTPRNVQTEKERVNMVFAVKVRLSNPGHLLKPGMPADAFLQPTYAP
ncbi:MAG: efflux RND transporter periplasmic adaptor subunit [Anaerolineae bacterium]|jgi:multidrug resistance efflux pump